MRVLLAGASGVIGPALLPRLAEAGHEVAAMTRTGAKAQGLREAGAEPIVCDVYDEAALEEAVAGARPEAVICHLTDLPQRIDTRDPDATAANDRLRTVGVPNLLRAVTAAGARRFVCQSIAFMYAPDRSGPARESEPLFVDAPGFVGRGARAVAAMERAVLGTAAVEGIVLRFGYWYGAGTAYADGGSIASDVRARRFPIVGGGHGVWSFIHVGDVATATVAALTDGAAGTYNVTDDDPAEVREWLPAYAEAIGAKRPLRVPKLVGRVAGGYVAVHAMTAARGADNTKAKRELGWAPAIPTWSQGFRTALG